MPRRVRRPVIHAREKAAERSAGLKVKDQQVHMRVCGIWYTDVYGIHDPRVTRTKSRTVMLYVESEKLECL